jgi:hypothetical protein
VKKLFVGFALPLLGMILSSCASSDKPATTTTTTTRQQPVTLPAQTRSQGMSHGM